MPQLCRHEHWDINKGSCPIGHDLCFSCVSSTVYLVCRKSRTGCITTKVTPFYASCSMGDHIRLSCTMMNWSMCMYNVKCSTFLIFLEHFLYPDMSQSSSASWYVLTIVCIMIFLSHLLYPDISQPASWPSCHTLHGRCACIRHMHLAQEHCRSWVHAVTPEQPLISGISLWRVPSLGPASCAHTPRMDHIT